MHDISDLNRDGLPSGATLVKATVVALVVGTALLITTVLPAEYGIDPTGLGARMGLTDLSATAEEETASEPDQASTDLMDADLSPVWRSATPFRSDTLELTLQPDEGAEIKAKMQAGERFVFSWEAIGGKVNFDMHGEQLNAGDDFSSYWKGRNQAGANGSFEAPFAGTHGWYWRNRGTEPVTVRVTTSGYYETLYKP